MSTNGNGNGQSKAIVRSSNEKLDTLKGIFDRSKGSIAAVIPKHITPDQILKVTLSAVSRTPALLDCTAQSILLCVMQAAALGLPPNTPLGLSYLVPYGKEAQFIPGYRGLIRLAIQSGEVQSIYSRIVHKNDALDLEYGTEQKLTHKPSLEEDAGPMIGAYAVAEMKNGSRVFEFMSRQQIDAIRQRSKASNNGPWVTDYEEMARKTAIRRLCKSLPLSEEKLSRGLEHAAAAEGGHGPDYSDMIDVQFSDGEIDAEPATNTEALGQRLAAKAAS